MYCGYNDFCVLLWFCFILLCFCHFFFNSHKHTHARAHAHTHTAAGAQVRYSKVCVCSGARPKLVGESPFVLVVRDTEVRHGHGGGGGVVVWW